MQFHSLSVFNKEKCNHFFEHLTDYFHKHHHSDEESPDTYENLLYTVKRPYSPEMLDEIDNWMGLPKRQWREETQREVMLSLYAIRYPDTLLLESPVSYTHLTLPTNREV